MMVTELSLALTDNHAQGYQDSQDGSKQNPDFEAPNGEAQ